MSFWIVFLLLVSVGVEGQSDGSGDGGDDGTDGVRCWGYASSNRSTTPRVLRSWRASVQLACLTL